MMESLFSQGVKVSRGNSLESISRSLMRVVFFYFRSYLHESTATFLMTTESNLSNRIEEGIC